MKAGKHPLYEIRAAWRDDARAADRLQALPDAEVERLCRQAPPGSREIALPRDYASRRLPALMRHAASVALIAIFNVILWFSTPDVAIVAIDSPSSAHRDIVCHSLETMIKNNA